MNIAQVNTFERQGGAARAAHRLHVGLRSIGVDSTAVVARGTGEGPSVDVPPWPHRVIGSRARSLLDVLPAHLHPGHDGGLFSTGLLPDRTGRRIRAVDPDIIHLHWINAGFLSIGSLSAFETPIVWTMHDMWPITGGCHYAGRCRRFESNCGRCPALGSSRSRDLSRLIWDKKSTVFDGLDLTVVTPSTWLAEQAAKSSLFSSRRIDMIPNGLDTTIFRPIPPAVGKNTFDLPREKRLILFGAMAPDAPRKGFNLLRQALDELFHRGAYEDVCIVVFGVSEPPKSPALNYPIHYTGYVDGNKLLASLYSTCDVMVVPSTAEAFGQTVSEAMASGTPVVSFDAGGPKDIIGHMKTGYLAEAYNPTDLADGIAWVLDDQERREQLGRQARARAVEQYDIETVAHQYRTLYEDILA